MLCCVPNHLSDLRCVRVEISNPCMCWLDIEVSGRWHCSVTVQYCNFKRSVLSVSTSLDMKSGFDLRLNTERSSVTTLTVLPLPFSQVIAVLSIHVKLRRWNGSSQVAVATHSAASAAGTCLNDVHTLLCLLLPFWCCAAWNTFPGAVSLKILSTCFCFEVDMTFILLPAVPSSSYAADKMALSMKLMYLIHSVLYRLVTLGDNKYNFNRAALLSFLLFWYRYYIASF